jgi:hypothetical protein
MIPVLRERRGNVEASPPRLNQGVFYYPIGSLKHRMCVAGRRLLYPYMEACGVAIITCWLGLPPKKLRRDRSAATAGR